MKKYLVGFLAAAFILSACTGIKSPKFNKYTNQVEFSEFNEKLDGIKLFPDGEESMVITTYCGVQNKETVALENRRLSHTEATMNSDFSYKYDKERQVATIDGKTETTGTQTGVNTSYQYADSNKVQEQLQAETVGDKQYVTRINKELKTFKYEKELVEGKTVADSLLDVNSNYAAAGLIIFALGVEGYEYVDEDEKAFYKFYIDNESVFTATYDGSETKETKTGTGDDEHVQYTTVEETNLVGQIVVSKDNKGATFLISYSQKKTTTYAENCTITKSGETKQHLKDEVNIEERVMSVTFKIQQKDVSLKKIDLSSYVETL